MFAVWLLDESPTVPEVDGVLVVSLAIAGEGTGSELLMVTVPESLTIFAARTATGVHAAAVIKSYRKGDTELADLIYSGVPAGQFGLKQVIEIGPMSGKSNVTYWLESRGLEASEDRVTRIYEQAKKASAVLSEEEVMAIISEQ